jgi:methylenetetrahydrofolate dehydrogenase (NADP+) / methenyltetrahydrofolate cyclohydrolase
MTRILDGKALAATLREEVATGVRELVTRAGRSPGLVAILVGEDPASQIYVTSKARDCSEVGIASRTLELPAETGLPELLAIIDELNAEQEVDGILVQLPLPAQLPSRQVLDRVDPDKDVDGFHPTNVGRLWIDEPGFLSATPAGILELLRRESFELAGARAVVLGRSNIVGKPLAALLRRAHCTVTVCHSRTRDLPAVTREADLLVAAIGRPAFVGAEHVKPGAVVVDVGINRLADEESVRRAFPNDPAKLERLRDRGSLLVGDVDYDRVAPLAAAITPVPGGVGPLTRAMLLVNTLQATRRRLGVA